MGNIMTTEQCETRELYFLDETTLAYSRELAYARESDIWMVPSKGYSCTMGYQVFENLSDLYKVADELYSRHKKRLATIKENLKKIRDDANGK